jgi:hypothetical protein
MGPPQSILNELKSINVIKQIVSKRESGDYVSMVIPKETLHVTKG